MTWSWDGLDGDSFGVSSQFLDNNGKKAGSEFQLNNYTVNSQTYAILATAGTNFFAVWESEGQDGDIRGIYGKLITGYGTDPLISDTDNDGLRDGNEVHDLDIDPLNPDSDDDGMNDGDEVYVGMEPDNADSLFALQNITLHDDLNCATINWFGSIASPDIEYKILWSDYPWSQWNEVETDNGDIGNNDGIRSWTDEGDNDAVPPRSQPTDSINRFYKVIVE